MFVGKAQHQPEYLQHYACLGDSLCVGVKSSYNIVIYAFFYHVYILSFQCVFFLFSPGVIVVFNIQFIYPCLSRWFYCLFKE